jgi:hypothetical protein
MVSECFGDSSKSEVRDMLRAVDFQGDSRTLQALEKRVRSHTGHLYLLMIRCSPYQGVDRQSIFARVDFTGAKQS